MDGVYSLGLLLAISCSAVLAYGPVTDPPMYEVYGGASINCYQVIINVQKNVVFTVVIDQCENKRNLQQMRAKVEAEFNLQAYLGSGLLAFTTVLYQKIQKNEKAVPSKY